FSCPFWSRLRGVGLRKSLINYRDDFRTRIRDAGVAGSNPVTPTTLKVGDFVEASYTEAIAVNVVAGSSVTSCQLRGARSSASRRMRAQVEAIACASPAFTTLLLSVIVTVLRASRRSTTRASTAPVSESYSSMKRVISPAETV